MSKLTYSDLSASAQSTEDKPLVWLHGEIKTPPFSRSARVETGLRLRQLQRGERLLMPHSRPMPSIGPRCHELRVTDLDAQWRVVYRIDYDAIVIAEVFAKKSVRTASSVLETCRQRLKRYDDAQTKAQSPRS